VSGRRASIAAASLVLLVACTSDSPRPAVASDASTSSAAPQCTPARNQEVGVSHTIPFGGEQRTYLLHVPATYDGRTPAPLVFDFHGFASNGPAEETNTALGLKGAARGYVVVTPSSDPPEWNEFSAPDRADDFGFVHALVSDLQTRLCIDTSRVYATGHSNGSAFVGFLACKPPLVFAAIAMVSATIPSLCPGDTGPSVFVVAGAADPQVPYDGGTVGGSTIQIPAVVGTLHGYADHYHCDPQPTQDMPIGGVQRLRFQRCVRGIEVRLDTIVGGTHYWPGSPDARSDPSDSQAGRDFDATSAILDFFDMPRVEASTAGPSPST
jgi:polyhydroxybutyrate depolymerase